MRKTKGDHAAKAREKPNMDRPLAGLEVLPLEAEVDATTPLRPQPAQANRRAMAEADKKVVDPKKAEKKVFDELDDFFCGFCSIQNLDQDGIAGQTLGTHIQAPLHILSEPGACPVVMEAVFLGSNPLFYCELRNEEAFYIFGRWWMNGPTYSEANGFCSLVPLKMQDGHKQMETTGTPDFTGTAHCPFIKGSTDLDKLFQVSFSTEEKRFKTKITKCTITVPQAAWKEYKAHRVRTWKAGKNWGATEKDADDDKKDDKKDD